MKKNKVKLQFNPETLSFERVEVSIWGRIKGFMLHLLSSSFIGFLFFVFFVILIDSPDERRLRHEIESMTLEYELMNNKLAEMNNVLSDIRQRDNNLYRVIFEADSIPSNVRHKIRESQDYLGSSSTIVKKTKSKVDDIAKQLYIQTSRKPFTYRKSNI